MRQLLGSYTGVRIAQMPDPMARPGMVVVAVRYSMVSTGTEITGLKNASLLSEGSLTDHAKKAAHYFGLSMRNPQKAIDKIHGIMRQKLQKTTGVQATDMDDQGWNLGYSASGVVLSVGDGVNEFSVGQHVACGGAGFANHAEIICVPVNLVSAVPKGCDLKAAAATTVSTIALQGVRRASVQIGERVAVIGLGLLGQLTVQMLKNAGCAVFGFDLDGNQVEQARGLGLKNGSCDVNKFKLMVRDATDGWGVDHVIVTAATKSSDPVNLATEIARRKGRVILVGDVGLTFSRADFYAKELDVVMSTSYGPGRYDPDYEFLGRDYPYSYVRWTLGRNMQSCLEMMADGVLDPLKIVTKTVAFDEAPKAYDGLVNAAPDANKTAGFMIEYPTSTDDHELPVVRLSGHKTPPGDTVNYALVGAGAFGISTLVPALKKAGGFTLKAVVSSDAVRGGNFARSEGVEMLSNNLAETVKQDDLDMVVIASRHIDHAEQTITALKAGMTVFVEKPLAVNWQQLEDIIDVYQQATDPLLMVGFNRRFSPAIQTLKKILPPRRGPLMINYRLNAGYLPKNHWQQTKEGGGRNIGEACHMYDVFAYLTNSTANSVAATAITPDTDAYQRNDNFSATIGYQDGSVCSLFYSALGSEQGLAKERIEIFCDGETYSVDDFKSLTRASDGKVLWQGNTDKGHEAEMQSMKAGFEKGIAPILFDEIVQTTALSLHIEDLLHGRVD